MKKLVVVALLFFLATFFVIEKKQAPTKTVGLLDTPRTNVTEEKRAVFISYLEYGTYLKGRSNEVQQANLIKMLDHLKNSGFNMILLQVRSFSDAIYPSSIFPWSSTISDKEGENPGFDVLSFVLKEAHKRKIEVHAWVNPYRVRNTTDSSVLSKTNPAYQWLNTSNVKVIDDVGIFYNPASKEVQDLVVSGIQEILDHYDVDGIHFDDYFYPSKDIDLISYLEYQKQGGTLTLEEYRLDQVNTLVKRVYEIVKKKDKKLLFGISPEGNIDNNYELNYADTKKWASTEGYVDYLMPQIYFGFENERRPFLKTVAMWNDLITAKNVKLMPALAFYKVGVEDKNALSGSKEWLDNSDIIKKQVVASRVLSNYQGFSLFRYDYMFGENAKNPIAKSEFDHLVSLFDEK